MSEYREKLLSIATPRRFGTSNRTVVPHEADGKPAGYHEEHWDGRVDAVVRLREPIRVGSKVNEEG